MAAATAHRVRPAKSRRPLNWVCTHRDTNRQCPKQGRCCAATGRPECKYCATCSRNATETSQLPYQHTTRTRSQTLSPQTSLTPHRESRGHISHTNASHPHSRSSAGKKESPCTQQLCSSTEYSGNSTQSQATQPPIAASHCTERRRMSGPRWFSSCFSALVASAAIATRSTNTPTTARDMEPLQTAPPSTAGNHCAAIKLRAELLFHSPCTCICGTCVGACRAALGRALNYTI